MMRLARVMMGGVAPGDDALRARDDGLLRGLVMKEHCGTTITQAKRHH